MIKLDQYELLMKYLKPSFVIFLIVFLIKELSYLFDILIQVQIIPDLLFLLVFAVYAFFDFLPYFGPQYIEGYTPPDREAHEETPVPSNKEEGSGARESSE